MRRADRLFRIVSLLRSGRLLTGAQLADRLSVSPRTIYRDMADLQRTGTPIEGEAGVGYTLRRDTDLPPMQFTAEELTALVLGARMVRAWAGEATGAAAADALVKIESVLPPDHRSRIDRVLLFAPGFAHPQRTRKLVDKLHAACTGERLLHLHYRRADSTESSRTVHPLGLYFWGGTWTLVAWCAHREAFRQFRLDRMIEATVGEDHFQSRRGQRLQDFLRNIRREAAHEAK